MNNQTQANPGWREFHESQPCPRDSGNGPACVSEEAQATKLIPVSCLLSKTTQQWWGENQKYQGGERRPPAVPRTFPALCSAQSSTELQTQPRISTDSQQHGGGLGGGRMARVRRSRGPSQGGCRSGQTVVPAGTSVPGRKSKKNLRIAGPENTVRIEARVSFSSRGCSHPGLELYHWFPTCQVRM